MKDRVFKEEVSPPCPVELELPGGGTVVDLLGPLDLPEKTIGLILINGRQANLGSPLGNGDRVDLFSPMSGG